MADDSTVHVGCSGCLTFIVGALLLWALLFGVTYDGKHYGVTCSCSRGVVIDK